MELPRWKLSFTGFLQGTRISSTNSQTQSRLAAREAYFAAFHAAEAYIFEHTGKVASTPRGVRSEFARLARLLLRLPSAPAAANGSEANQTGTDEGDC
jgi:hypothetical protein